MNREKAKPLKVRPGEHHAGGMGNDDVESGKSIHDLIGNNLDEEVMGHIHVAGGESTGNLDNQQTG